MECGLASACDCLFIFDAEHRDWFHVSPLDDNAAGHMGGLADLLDSCEGFRN